MSLVINTNTSSLTAQNNLTKSTNSLAQATERLSSGLKINSAADNAAGYAISTRFTTQIGGLSQASSNASDAISLAQTTESALDQVTSNLQAIRDLAVQSANGTYTDSDRQAINSEVQQRLAEITRIANQTDFNGTKVLDGSTGSLSFQVGANVGQTISVNLGSGTRADQIGGIATQSSSGLGALFVSSGSAAVPGGVTLAAGALSVGGTAVAAGTYTTAAALATAINAASAGAATVTAGGEISIAAGKAVAGTGLAALGLTAGANAGGETTTTVASSIAGTAAVASGTAQSVTLGSGDLTIDGTSITGTFNNVQDLSDAINAANISGVSAAVNGAGTDLNLYSDTALTVGGSGATSGVLTSGTDAVSGSLAGGNVSTVDAANDLASRIDVALTSVSNLASNLGAVQNRFTSTISTLSAESDNLTSSQSTIQDADFAAETANLSKSQVLQQAGIAVLSQANSQPQQVLKLLQ
jgi:flagellin